MDRQRQAVWIRLAAGVAAALVVVLLVAAVVGGFDRPGGAPQSPAESPSGAAEGVTPLPPTPVPTPEILVGAGDIANCGAEGDDQTAALLDSIDGTVFAAGDNAYPSGRTKDYENCYEPTWGRQVDRTLPVPGNHDWNTSGAKGYLEYFGDRAAPDGVTWYAVEVGAWQVITLDSECDEVDGCDERSAQYEWLRETLAADDHACTIAIWHKPRFSSGFHGNDDDVAPFWKLLYDAGADVVVNGHDHDYERFAPMDPSGARDDERGITEFVVGTGGTTLRDFEEIVDNSEVRDASTHGVLQLTLWPDRYTWQFIPVAGETFRDSGSGRCH